MDVIADVRESSAGTPSANNVSTLRKGRCLLSTSLTPDGKIRERVGVIGSLAGASIRHVPVCLRRQIEIPAGNSVRAQIISRGSRRVASSGREDSARDSDASFLISRVISRVYDERYRQQDGKRRVDSYISERHNRPPYRRPQFLTCRFHCNKSITILSVGGFLKVSGASSSPRCCGEQAEREREREKERGGERKRDIARTR